MRFAAPLRGWSVGGYPEDKRALPRNADSPAIGMGLLSWGGSPIPVGLCFNPRLFGLSDRFPGRCDRSGNLSGGRTGARIALESRKMLTVSFTQIPQAHIASLFARCARWRIVVLVRIVGVKPGRAQITEVCPATAAQHMITALDLLRCRSALRAQRGVQFNVFERGQLSGRKAILAVSRAKVDLAVP